MFGKSLKVSAILKTTYGVRNERADAQRLGPAVSEPSERGSDAGQQPPTEPESEGTAAADTGEPADRVPAQPTVSSVGDIQPTETTGRRLGESNTGAFVQYPAETRDDIPAEEQAPGTDRVSAGRDPDTWESTVGEIDSTATEGRELGTPSERGLAVDNRSSGRPDDTDGTNLAQELANCTPILP